MLRLLKMIFTIFKNDIYDFFKSAISSRWNFVVRAGHDRQVQINEAMKRIFPWISKQPAKCKFKT
jgi:hypothetical protein